MVREPMQMKLPARPATDRNSRASVALARAILPSTAAMEGASENTVRHTERFLSRLLPEAVEPWRRSQRAIVESARLFTGKPLDELTPEEAAALVERWAEHPVMRRIVNGVASLYKVTHFDLPDTRGTLRTPLRVIGHVERPRWHQRVCRAADWDESEVLECDVVIVGTGAGGAVVGRHLADQGHAVVFVEEGELKQRNEFPRNFVGTIEQVYRSAVSVGNSPMFIPQGQLVGGSTAVNTGTSFRPPRWIMDRWCEEFDSDEFSPDNLDQYFTRVETTLQVEPPDLRYVGPVHDMFKKGAESLGWHADRIPRNAPGCRGEGFCDNGCPTDARRSTNLSYLPPAMDRGAFLLSAFRADKVVMRQGRVAGLEGIAIDEQRKPISKSNGQPKRIRITAKNVIVSAGALSSPLFLLRQGLGNRAQLGRHLTLHPSGPSVGNYEQEIRGNDYIPQSVYSNEFLGEGILLLGAAAEPHMVPPTLPFLGRRLMHVMEQHDHLAGMGFLIRDATEGRLHLGPGGKPVLTYNLSKKDVQRVHKAQVLLARMQLEAGAKEVYPGLLRPFTVRNETDVQELERMRLDAGDFLLTSYHPLGTCRMSPDPKEGVVDLNHQCHGVPGLFVVDGSTVRGPLGVNPQISVMALATRAAEKIGPLIDS